MSPLSEYCASKLKLEKISQEIERLRAYLPNDKVTKKITKKEAKKQSAEEEVALMLQTPNRTTNVVISSVDEAQELLKVKRLGKWNGSVSVVNWISGDDKTTIRNMFNSGS